MKVEVTVQPRGCKKTVLSNRFLAVAPEIKNLRDHFAALRRHRRVVRFLAVAAEIKNLRDAFIALHRHRWLVRFLAVAVIHWKSRDTFRDGMPRAQASEWRAITEPVAPRVSKGTPFAAYRLAGTGGTFWTTPPLPTSFSISSNSDGRKLVKFSMPFSVTTITSS